MLDLLEKYREIIKEYHVTSFDQESGSYRIKINITFIDDSTLYIKEFFFKNDERKYSYHWIDTSGNLLCRWDNAHHYENIATFPHHKHIESDVVDSRETTIEEILLIIYKEITR